MGIKRVKPVIGALLLLAASGMAFADTEEYSGKQDFLNYCASCHGLDGKGMASAQQAGASKPKNLTLLSKNNGGQFPYLYVRSVIDGRIEAGNNVGAHMKGKMPVWGDIFVAEKGASAGGRLHGEAVAKMRILNIVDYLVSIQAVQ